MSEGVANKSTTNCTTFLWENHPWVNHSNSDDSDGGAGDHGGDCQQETSGGKKRPGLNSNNSLQTAQAPKKRRGGRGGAGKNGRGTSTTSAAPAPPSCNGSEEVNIKEGRVVGGGGGGESDHELHIWTERERRKKMRNMFSNLHALLPQLPPKVFLSFVSNYKSYSRFKLIIYIYECYISS